MALTKEQANKIKIDPDVIVGFSDSGGDICAEQLAKWAYRRLETWPDFLDCIQEILPVIKCLKQSELYESWISRAEQIITATT